MVNSLMSLDLRSEKASSIGFRSGEYAGRYSSLIPLLTRSMRVLKEREMNLLRLNDLPNPGDLVDCTVVHDDDGIPGWEGLHFEDKVGYEGGEQISVERTLNDHTFDDAVVEGDCRQNRVPVIVSEDSKRDMQQLTFCPAQSIAFYTRGVPPEPKPDSSSTSFCRKCFRPRKRVVPVCSSRRFKDDIQLRPVRCAPQRVL